MRTPCLFLSLSLSLSLSHSRVGNLQRLPGNYGMTKAVQAPARTSMPSYESRGSSRAANATTGTRFLEVPFLSKADPMVQLHGPEFGILVNQWCVETAYKQGLVLKKLGAHTSVDDRNLA